MTSRKGFTLLEALAVLTILVMLGAVAFAVFQNVSEEAKRLIVGRIDRLSPGGREMVIVLDVPLPPNAPAALVGKRVVIALEEDMRDNRIRGPR